MLGVDVRHSESLLPAIAFALDRARLAVTDLGGVIVGAGPGSFTGVRIAAATAKGLVHALGIPMFAYSSLEAMAAGVAAAGRPVCAMLDARRGEVYAACYIHGASGLIETLLAPTARPVDEVVVALAARSPLHAGEGASRHAERIECAGGEVAKGPSAVPRATALVWLASNEPERGRVGNASTWQPGYARGSAAKPMA
jgi:tRNA threonylcarbamoyladenosine biosynthesis protein TsaB